MTRKFLSIAAVLSAALLPLAAPASQHIVLKSQTITLPTTDKVFPAGPNVDVVNGNCLACHSIEMVFNQPNLSKAGWESEVNKMRNVYKAPIDEKDVGPIVDYLAAVRGTK